MGFADFSNGDGVSDMRQIGSFPILLIFQPRPQTSWSITRQLQVLFGWIISRIELNGSASPPVTLPNLSLRWALATNIRHIVELDRSVHSYVIANDSVVSNYP